MIVYQGPSRLDRQPIVAILTGLDRPSHNPKTGRMAQLWILRGDISPLAAIDSGADYSVCGNCMHRGAAGEHGKGSKGRSCYVMVKNAPLQIWRAFMRGNYRHAGPMLANYRLRQAGMAVRLGAYGDPAALPIATLEQLCKGVAHTGYTHQWLHLGPRYARLLMASVDVEEDRTHAKLAGWRTFRAKLADEPNGAREVSCPASAEAGHRTTCENCKLCAGAEKKAADVSINVHGFGARTFIQLRRVAA